MPKTRGTWAVASQSGVSSSCRPSSGHLVPQRLQCPVKVSNGQAGLSRGEDLRVGTFTLYTALSDCWPAAVLFSLHAGLNWAAGSVRTRLPISLGSLGGREPEALSLGCCMVPEPKISLSVCTWAQDRQGATRVAGGSSLRAKA